MKFYFRYIILISQESVFENSCKNKVENEAQIEETPI